MLSFFLVYSLCIEIFLWYCCLFSFSVNMFDLQVLLIVVGVIFRGLLSWCCYFSVLVLVFLLWPSYPPMFFLVLCNKIFFLLKKCWSSFFFFFPFSIQFYVSFHLLHAKNLFFYFFLLCAAVFYLKLEFLFLFDVLW